MNQTIDQTYYSESHQLLLTVSSVDDEADFKLTILIYFNEKFENMQTLIEHSCNLVTFLKLCTIKFLYRNSPTPNHFVSLIMHNF